MVIEYDEGFWFKPLSKVFMTALQEFLEYLQNRRIPYFWNSEYNLIETASEDTLFNWCNRINTIIKEINRDPENAYKYFSKNLF